MVFLILTEKKARHRKKAQKSTMVFLKALTTIPEVMYFAGNTHHAVTK